MATKSNTPEKQVQNVPATETKVYARVAGSYFLITDNKVVGSLSGVFVGEATKGKAVDRQRAYALGRTFSKLTEVVFFTMDGEKENVLATAVPDGDNWTVQYADGKEHPAEKQTFTRSETKKASKRWKNVPLNSGGRDLGPDLMLASGRVLAELGLVDGRSVSDGSTKAKLEEANAQLAALKAKLMAMGMSEAEVDALIANSAEKKQAAEAEAEAEADQADAEESDERDS